MTMPTIPHRPPKRMMENMTQKPDRPVRLPRILGPMMLPSTCWRSSTKITKVRAFTGLSIRISSVAGTAPITGPKKGMMLVTPTITDTSTALGMRSSAHPM